MRRIARLIFSTVSLIFLCLLFGSQARVGATVFRDRAAFNAASQNLNTIDFESEPHNFSRDSTIDGIIFRNIGGPPVIVSTPSGKVLEGLTVGEITWMTVFLPPGTTAVGCDQFSTPMDVTASTGESVTMTQSDGSDFVGFVSDTPIETLTIKLDFPEPTPNVLLDNFTYGQRRVEGGLPVPQLLVTNDTGRAVAFDSVTTMAEPFPVVSARNLIAADRRTRVTLFLIGVRFDDPQDAQLVTARAENSQHVFFDLPVEAVGRVKNLSWMAQVTVRLPDELSEAGDVSVSVSVRGVESNKATLRIENPDN
ncbi:MAG TPA: hypothetical protein VEX60_18950 [Pyrinomonadaceae bacterium]|nr:hypothetical protein [Pyrinomonadaceae bacterium]